MAGMVPGIFIGVAFMVYNYIHCKVTGMGEKSSFSAKRLAKSFISAVPALMVPVILLTGMYSGIYTPTEGAGIAVAYAVLVSIYVYKRLKWADIPRIIAKNARQTGTILFIAITAKPARSSNWTVCPPSWPTSSWAFPITSWSSCLLCLLS